MQKIYKIRKRDGRTVGFEQEKIVNAIHRAISAAGKKDGKLAQKLSDEVVKTLEKRFVKIIPSVENVQDIVIEVFSKKGYKKIAKEYSEYRKRKEEIRKTKKALGIEPEIKLTVNSLIVLQKRYLLKNENGKIIETPAQMFRRVARAISSVEYKCKYCTEVEKTEEEFYKALSKLEFLPNSPTLFNAGTKNNFGLSACYVLPVPDSLEGIFDAVKNMSLIEQGGGGVGFSFSNLRPKGDMVRSTKGVSSGPASFMRVFDIATDVIKAGGKRRGAMMGVLRVDHPDILEFITAKSRPGLLSNFNVSVAITDAFLDTMKKNKEYILINPRTGKAVKKLKAKFVWDLIVENAWKTGDPGLIFIDEINRHNPTPEIGKIEGTNPCVTSDTWIMTKNGPMQVKNLIDKSFVAIVNGKEFESRKGFFFTGKKPVFRLKTKEDFEIRLTANHPILIVKKLTRHKIETKWKKLNELNIGNRVILNDHKTISTWVGNYTEKEGYIMGLLVGDGSISKEKIFLASWGDTEGQVNVRNLAYNFVLDFPHRADFTGWMKVKGRNEYRMALAYFKKLSSSLGMNYNFKTITKEIENASYDFYIGFLRGLFDTDGSVQGKQEKGVSIRLSQSNLELLKATQNMLLRLGIISKIYKNRRMAQIRVMPNGKGGYKEYHTKSNHELIIAKENILRFYKKIGFGDSDKTKQLEDLIKDYKREFNRERFVATIEEITYDGIEDVYDTRINNLHAFDGNGFILHNCGEQPLLPFESCNLGSINLSKMVDEKGNVDWNKLRKTVKIAVQFLDDVIDANVFPLKEIEEITKANRKIGLGIMGWSDLLVKLKIPYDSEKALALAEKLMKFITEEARKKSEELGKERRSFPNFEKSILKRKYKSMRNATVTTIAPTGTVSIIAGTSSGIEPLFAISFIRNVLEGANLLEVNSLFEKIAKERGFYSGKLLEEIAKTGSIQKIKGIPKDVKKIFKTALDIKPEWHVRMQAAFQKYTDNAVSKTINLPANATKEDVKKAFELSYKLKCKGITVYRYGSKPTQVLYVGGKKEVKRMTAEAEYAGGCPTSSCPSPA